MTVLKPLTPEELDRVIPLGLHLLLEGSHPGAKIDEAKVRAWIERASKNDGVFAMIAEHNGNVVGLMIGYTVTPWWAKDGYRHTADSVLYVLPQARRLGVAKLLSDAFLKWSASIGCRHAYLSQSTGVEVRGATHLFEKLGGKHVGNCYRMELNHV